MSYVRPVGRATTKTASSAAVWLRQSTDQITLVLNHFFFFPTVFSLDDKMLTDKLKSICDSLVVNNRNTSNFKTLIRVLFQKADLKRLGDAQK